MIHRKKLTKDELENKDMQPVIMWLMAKPTYDPMDFYKTRHQAQLPDESLVKMHKRVFGQQALCWQGATHRQWVWEFDTGLMIFVSNHRGVAYEMPKATTLLEVEAAMATYLEELLEYEAGSQEEEK